jgi:ABC-2 type transport system ATP-binding protein
MIVETKGLTKDFGDQRALDDINLSIAPGVVVGLIGPSGCGKTTLVRTLTGIIGPTEGEVRVFGSDPARFGTRERRRFGYMPQLPVLFPNLTVWENLSFIASVYGMSLRQRRRHLKALLELVDLGPHRKKRLSECSGGMQRRLALASTLVHDPELLFLDEPTAGVDPILRERFWTHFRALRDQGRTIVVPTQYVGEAVSCDVVAVMAHGQLITVQPPERLARYAYGGDALAVDLDGGWLSGGEVERLRSEQFIRRVRRTENGLTVVVTDAERDGRELRRMFEGAGIAVGSISPLEPSFDDIFFEIIDAHSTAEQRAAA